MIRYITPILLAYLSIYVSTFNPHETYQSQIPIKKALRWIVFSMLSVLLLAGMPLWYYKHLQNRYALDEAYRITSIVQTASDRELLPTLYLAEQMQLSFKRPTNLYQFNSNDAEKRLQSNPLIKWAKVKKIRPGTIYVDYALRRPIAYLRNFPNTAMDEDGFLFPSAPFLTPKKLPEIYLGRAFNKESSVLIELKLIRELIGLIAQTATLKRIDLSRVDAPSLGQKQIILVLEEQWERQEDSKPVMFSGLRVLRLNVDNYREGLEAYMILQKYLTKTVAVPKTEVTKVSSLIRLDPVVIDLRLSHLAYLWEPQKKE